MRTEEIHPDTVVTQVGADGAGFVNEVARCSTGGIPLSRWWYTAGLNLRYSAPAVLYLALPPRWFSLQNFLPVTRSQDLIM
jgi:hypothetical protein